jgi:hypothetical protein
VYGARFEGSKEERVRWVGYGVGKKEREWEGGREWKGKRV